LFHTLLIAGKREVRFERAVVSSLAATLGHSVHTVQRHLHLLRELGLVGFVERRRWRGRYSGQMSDVKLFRIANGSVRQLTPTKDPGPSLIFWPVCGVRVFDYLILPLLDCDDGWGSL
jgi:hypothetical protein